MPGETPTNSNVFNSMVGSAPTSSAAPSPAPVSSPSPSSSSPGPTPSSLSGTSGTESHREVVDSKVDPSKSSSPAEPRIEKYKVQGKEYTREEIASNPELLQAIFSGYTKQSGLQKKIDKQMKDFQALQEQHQQAQSALQQHQQQWADSQAQRRSEPGVQGQAQPGTSPLTPQALATYYGPAAQQTASEGFMEPDFVAAYPQLSANLMFFRDLIGDAREAIQTMAGHMIRTRQEGQVQQRNTQMDGLRSNVIDTISGLASKDDKGTYTHGEEFAPLADAGVREGFIEYLREIKAPVQLVLQSPDFLRNHWFAYNAPVIQEAQRQLRDADKRQARTRATGEGTAYHPGASKPQEGASPVFDQMVEFGISKLASKSNF